MPPPEVQGFPGRSLWLAAFVAFAGPLDLLTRYARRSSRAHIQSLDLPGQFGVPPPKPPKKQPWGLTIAYVIGPCGELWHVTQKPK